MKKIVLNLSAGLVVIFIIMCITSCNKDKTPPEITILGNNPVNTCFDMTYTDAGATAYDDEDGDITDKIETTSNVDTMNIDTYYVKYVVIDNAGNRTEATRTVNVIYCK